MQWILEHFQFVVIVALALGSWLKNRWDAKKEAEQSYDPREVFGAPGEVEWGAPNAYPPPLAGSRVPPKLPPRLPSVVVPPTVDADAVLKHQQELAERLRQIREARAATGGAGTVPRARPARGPASPAPVAAGASHLKSRLRNPRELRNALIMKEILDRPVSLR